MLSTLSPPPQQRPPLSVRRPVGTWTVHGPEDLVSLRQSVLTAVLSWRDAHHRSHPARQDHLTLIATELATNALKYGAPPVITSLYRQQDGWLIDVEDGHADTAPLPYPPEPGRPGRNGILIVSKLSRRWGWYAHHADTARKHVWAWLRD